MEKKTLKRLGSPKREGHSYILVSLRQVGAHALRCVTLPEAAPDGPPLLPEGVSPVRSWFPRRWVWGKYAVELAMVYADHCGEQFCRHSPSWRNRDVDIGEGSIGQLEDGEEIRAQTDFAGG